MLDTKYSTSRFTEYLLAFRLLWEIGCIDGLEHSANNPSRMSRRMTWGVRARAEAESKTYGVVLKNAQRVR